MQIFKSTGIKFPLLILFLLAGVFGTFLPARAEVYRREIGDTVELTRPLTSIYHVWELEGFEGRFFELVDEVIHNGEQAEFKFRALEAGTESFRLQRVRRTAFVEDVEDSREITMVAYIPDEPDEPDEPEDPVEEDLEEVEVVEEEEIIAEAEYEVLAEVDELFELERYENARELINQQLDDPEDEQAEIRWLEKLAESYYLPEEFSEAIATWEEIIDSFPDESPVEWLYRIADSYREAGEDDEAELVLLRLRHRHRHTYRWSDAMKMLAEIAIDRDNHERAAGILEELRAAYREPVSGDVLWQLARLYDRYEPVRDYEQAVEYYRRAARQLEANQPDRAEEANSRADYLLENYVEFGVR